MAFFEAEVGGDAGLFEDLLECTAVSVGRAFPLQALNGVVGDQVHLGSETTCVA